MKYKISVAQIYRLYRGNRVVNGRSYRTLEVNIPTEKGIRTIWWGAVPLTVVKPYAEPVVDQKYVEWITCSDLVQRLQANKCEVCGSQGDCEVHHVRKLVDLKKRWAGDEPNPNGCNV